MPLGEATAARCLRLRCVAAFLATSVTWEGRCIAQARRCAAQRLGPAQGAEQWGAHRGVHGDGQPSVAPLTSPPPETWTEVCRQKHRLTKAHRALGRSLCCPENENPCGICRARVWFSRFSKHQRWILNAAVAVCPRARRGVSLLQSGRT